MLITEVAGWLMKPGLALSLCIGTWPFPTKWEVGGYVNKYGCKIPPLLTSVKFSALSVLEIPDKSFFVFFNFDKTIYWELAS